MFLFWEYLYYLQLMDKSGFKSLSMNGGEGNIYIYPSTKDCTSFTNIDHILSYEASLNTFQNVNIQSILSGHNVIKLGIDKRP